MSDIKQLKADTNIVDVVSKYVSLAKKGSEFVGNCPFHEDKTASFKVNEKKQIFKCFGCGEGGDVFNFLTAQGKSLGEAIQEIEDPLNINAREYGNGIGNTNKNESLKKPETTVWNTVFPFPELKEISHYEYGTPHKIWTYVDENGNDILHVCRFNFPDGSKQTLPLVWASNGKFNGWRWMKTKGFNTLYNLDLLKQYPRTNVVLVEGEKTAQYLQDLVTPSKLLFTTWSGGANGIHNVDFSPLTERNIIVWPDNDKSQKYGDKHKLAGQIKPWHEQPGNEAMLKVASLIQTNWKRWLNVPAQFPHKWDGADEDWINEDAVIKFVRDNMVEIPIITNEIETAVIESKEKKFVYDSTRIFENDYFRFLGYDKDETGKLNYYFFAFDAKSVIRLSPSSMTKSNLMMLAPINWWEQKYPGSKTNINIDAAQQFLIGYSHTVGIYSAKSIRGRGAWFDSGKVVIHTGEHLIVDNETVPLMNFRSKYVYEVSEKIDFAQTQPLRSDTGKQILSMIKKFKWEREVNAYLLAGWCVISPFCGLLTWRPHAWVNGPSGSGKSWIMENIVKKLIGDIGVVMQGRSTEAYIRGKLKNDALPVIFDESDVDASYSDKERMQNNLSLVRASSYGKGGVIGKGTQTGGYKEYTINSCFMFFSIGVQLNQRADYSRFSMLGLKAFEGYQTDSEFATFIDKWNSIVSDDVVKQLQTRTMRLLPKIIKNSKTFSDAVSAEIGNRRIGDQVGGMLAGAYSLGNEDEISMEKAIEFIKKLSWEEEKGLEQTKDEIQLLSKIMSHITTVEGQYSKHDRTIGELVSLVIGTDIESDISVDHADKKLRRIGIRIKGDEILISNSSNEIFKIIKETSWSENYNKILERIEGAKKIDSTTFTPGLRSRAVSIPAEFIMKGMNS